jgi:predicted 2-oxoglutarate/Fe(II)-dependent dioxygenase YbiX
VFALNNDYTGGQIQFENRIGNDLISMSAGEILIYPSNENYKHKELPVTNGTKYTAIAYF